MPPTLAGLVPVPQRHLHQIVHGSLMDHHSMKILLQVCQPSVYERVVNRCSCSPRRPSRTTAFRNTEAAMLTTNRYCARQRFCSRDELGFAMQVAIFCLLLWSGKLIVAQTAATGALKGVVTDPSASVVPAASVKVTSYATGQIRTVVTPSNGSYLIPYLEPGNYKVEVSATGFKSLAIEKIEIHVTETRPLDLRLQVGTISETVTVRDIPELVQTDSSALGNVTDERMVQSLPLVTRNYTQLLALSPRVSGEVNNSASIGRGDSSQAASTGGYSAGGNATNDNTFQMNGAEVNDLIGD